MLNFDLIISCIIQLALFYYFFPNTLCQICMNLKKCHPRCLELSDLMFSLLKPRETIVFVMPCET